MSVVGALVLVPLLGAVPVLSMPNLEAHCADATTATTTPAPVPLAAPKPTYTTKYDNINVDMILRNEMMLKGYMDCLMDRKPCTKEGKILKEIIPDALMTECQRCSPKQKEQAGHILSYLLQYKKHYWNELIAKYDPSGSFRKKYEVEEDEDESEEEK